MIALEPAGQIVPRRRHERVFALQVLERRIFACLRGSLV